VFEKCCVTCVQRISNSDNVLKCNTVYTIGDHVLRNSNETRDLGIIIDNKLNFNLVTYPPFLTRPMFVHPLYYDHLLLGTL